MKRTTVEIDEQEYRKFQQLQQKSDAEAQFKTKTLKTIDTLLSTLSLTDVQCAKLLLKAGTIKLAAGSLYQYDNKTKLWKQHTETPAKCTAISDTFQPIVSKLSSELRNAIETIALDAERSKQVKKVLPNVKIIESSRKLSDISKACGNLMVDSALFNHKIYSDSLLPINDNKCVNLTNMEVQERRQDDYFTFSLDLSIKNSTKDAERFLRSYCPDDDDDTYHYLLDILSYCITPWNFLKKFFVFPGSTFRRLQKGTDHGADTMPQQVLWHIR